MSRLTFTVGANLRILFERADVIGNSTSPYAPMLSGIARRRRFYGVYHHFAGSYSRERHGISGWIPWCLEQALLRFGRHYVISNEAVAQKIRDMNPKAEVLTTFNAFDSRLLDLEPRIASPPFVLFVGRLDVHMKGLDLLISAYEAAASSTDVDLVLTGRCSESAAEAVRALIPDSLRSRVRIEPNISEDRKAELLSSCLFFCSPSRVEGFGIAALEANAAGKAVLATDVDGFRASLAFGETALAVPPENADALGSAMRRLIEDSDLCERLGRRGRERARAFGWEAIAEKEWEWVRALAPHRADRRS
jgi:glycosyltransferase involved in cell wall biosynthesis